MQDISWEIDPSANPNFFRALRAKRMLADHSLQLGPCNAGLEITVPGLSPAVRS